MSTQEAPSADDFLNEGSGPPAAKFPEVGAVVTGEVIAAKVGYARRFGTGEVDVWPNGDPKRQLQVDLRTPEGDLRVYCKPACKDAIAEAVQTAGGRLSDGGKLTIKRIEDGTPSQAGFNAPQAFRAKFEPKAVTADDLDF